MSDVSRFCQVHWAMGLLFKLPGLHKCFYAHVNRKTTLYSADGDSVQQHWAIRVLRNGRSSNSMRSDSLMMYDVKSAVKMQTKQLLMSLNLDSPPLQLQSVTGPLLTTVVR